MSHKIPAVALVAILLAAVLVGLAPTAQASFHGNFGSFVTTLNDKDFVALLESAPAGFTFCFGYMDDSTNPGDATKRAWMFHVSEASCSVGTDRAKSGQTWLITAFGGTVQQKWLTTSDTTYVDKAFTALNAITTGANWMCYLEADGLAGYSIGDPIYIKSGFGTTATLQINDLRLASVTSSTLTPFSVSTGIVKSADADLDRSGKAVGGTVDPTQLPTSDALTCGGFEVKILNMGGTTRANSGDGFYLFKTADMAATDRVIPGCTGSPRMLA